MRILLFSLLFTGSITLAQPVPSILVYHDVAGEYGNAVLEAIDALWPSCIPEIYTGADGQNGFNTALNLKDWDIVVLECWSAPTNGINWYQVSSMYLSDEAEFFVYNWHWYGSSSGQFPCFQSMGINDLMVSSYNDSMFVWDFSHPVTQNIADWSQYLIYPGGGPIVRQIKFDWGSSYPVTGWNEGFFDFGGICIANDGESIVSGFCPAYAREGVAIWMNILAFLWNENAIESTTWGAIKSCIW